MSYGYQKIGNNIHERQRILYPWMTFNPIFNPQELGIISGYCAENKNLIDGTTLTKNGIEHRKSKVNFYYANDEKLSWVFTRINSFLDDVNSVYFNFDLNGYDTLQYTEYDAEEGGKYDYHMDTITGLNMPADQYETRKLSLTMLLNDPNEDFTGGDFSVYTGEEENVSLKMGDIVVFPSFMVHRVNQITKGIRKSLVIWVYGPKFK